MKWNGEHNVIGREREESIWLSRPVYLLW
jgi:hypothetical protein